MKTATVAGTGIVGSSAAQQLRAQGFDSRLMMEGRNTHAT